MLNLERCKELLNKRKRKYNDEEIKFIREILYQFAELELENENSK